MTAPAPDGAAWAYDFTFERPLEALLDAFNAAGPWPWQGRESHWYGTYLNSRPMPGVRLRVHHFPDQPRPFSALLEIAPGAAATRAGIDAVFRKLLEEAGARDLTEIEPYVLENGRITLKGTGHELLQNDQVRQAYMGL